ncbi:MAG: type 4 fimbrial biogenesis protein PilM [uncultured bacterium]|nr:MAG: type 4 fimbrial biogenesis protein PilM [uncultured bacterium]
MILSCSKPAYLIGLALRRQQLTLVKVKKYKEQHSVLGFESLPLPADFIVEGKIKQPEKVTHLIRQLIQMTGSEGFYAAISLPSAYVLHKRITLPNYLTDRECEAEIETRISHYLPGINEELYFDYVRSISSEENVLLVAARKEQITSFVHAVEKAKLKVRIVDVDIYALHRAIQLISSAPIQAVLDMDGMVGQFIIWQKNKIIFTYAIFLNSDENFLQQMERLLQLFNTTTNVPWDKTILLSGNVISILPLVKVIEDKLQLKIEISNPFIAGTHSVENKKLYHVAPELIVAFGLTLRKYPTW